VEKGASVQSIFHDYPLLRATEMPEIRIHFVRATDEPIVGIGEEALGWVPHLCAMLFSPSRQADRSLPSRITTQCGCCLNRHSLGLKGVRPWARAATSPTLPSRISSRERKVRISTLRLVVFRINYGLTRIPAEKR